jgi:hypothetical protein
VALADEYLLAAELLMQRGRPGEPLSRAPARLCAIHAIELYLNAFLLDRGVSHAQVRAQMHNLADRTELALAHGLVLRKLTREHLVKMTDDREYLVSRYGPEMSATLSQVNRLMATLNELAKKVRIRIGSNPTKLPGPQEGEPGAFRTAAAARPIAPC